MALAIQKSRTQTGHRTEAAAAIRQPGGAKSRPALDLPAEPAVPVRSSERTHEIRSVAGTTINPLSLLFDIDWYLASYPDVASASLDPVRHYIDNGAREGRDPNPFFATSWYLSTYADVASSNMNPFLHYILYGAREGRQPRP